MADERVSSRGLIRTVWLVGAHAAGVAAVAIAAWRLRGFLVLVALAAVTALTLDPVVSFLERHRIPRGVGVALTVVVGLALLALAALGLVPMLGDQISSLNEATGGELKRFVARVGPGSLRGGGPEASISGITRWAGPLVDVARSAAGVAGAVLTVALLAVLWLLFGRDLEALALGFLDPKRRGRAEERLRHMRQAVSRYMAGALATSTLGAVVTMALLLVLHVRYFALIGVLMVGLGLIPTVGPLIGEILVGLATLQAGGIKRALIAVAVLMAYETFSAHVLTPLVQGKALQMNPLLMTLVLLAGTQLGGIPGAILSLPIAAAAQVRVQEFKAARADRWNEPRSPDEPRHSA